MFGSLGIISYLCRRSGKDPFGRRSVMHQPCEWKRRKLSFEISKRAQRLPRYTRGAVDPISYQGISYDLHSELAKQSRASAME